MKALSGAIVLGISLFMVSGSPARAQLGGMGEAVKKGAADAVKQEVMKGAAEQAGVPVAGTPGAAPAAAGAPAGEPKVAPAAPEKAAPAAEAGGATAPAGTPAAAPAAADTPAPTGAAGETMMDKARQKAMEEGSKKMMPKLP